ncbi:MAG: response regulator [Cyanobacteria bacterium REEB65]|nr:response regulator [Cyanobacteria bacterium REEB65]
MDPETILIAEDNASIRQLLSFIVERAAKRIPIEAVDGISALALARARKPGLVILDIKMPELNGYEVAEALKADPETRGIRILMLSALTMPWEIQWGLDHGADEFMTKPFDCRKLVARIGALLGQGTLAEAVA